MLVSIIIPVYNVEKYVKRCFKSVSEQTYQNIEIIVVDDGSTDSSGKLCDEFSRAEKRAVVIHKENGGLSSARNVGMKMAKGEYITFLDSDDFLALDFVEKAMLLCEKNSAEMKSWFYHEKTQLRKVFIKKCSVAVHQGKCIERQRWKG